MKQRAGSAEGSPADLLLTRYRHTVCMHGADSEVSACFESHHRFYFLFREPLQLDTRHKVTLPARSLFCLAFLPCFTPRSSRTGARACPWVGSVPASCGPGPGHADTSGRQVTQHGPGFNIHCVRLQPCATHFCLKTRCMQHTRRRIQWKSPQ